MLNLISNSLKGKKTYAGILLTVIGMTSLSAYVTSTDVSVIVDEVFKIAGVVIAVYGRYQAGKK